MVRKGVFYTMKYGEMIPGRFCTRPNRFVAHVELKGQEEICHVKNTGRCRELLLQGPGVGAGLTGIRSGKLTRSDCSGESRAAHQHGFPGAQSDSSGVAVSRGAGRGGGAVARVDAWGFPLRLFFPPGWTPVLFGGQGRDIGRGWGSSLPRGAYPAGGPSIFWDWPRLPPRDTGRTFCLLSKWEM